VTVRFSGVVTGQTTPDGSGNFATVLTASALGEVDAAGLNSQLQTVGTASGQLTNTPPVIRDFYGVQQPDGSYLFTGTVTDEYAPGLTITFGGNIPGMQNQTVQVASDGTFSFDVQLPANAHGTVSAITTDWWGAPSNQALTTI
jgi:hypothetical protein